uniref:Uncharacterized protein n=1 Tax=Globodera pallida TaxID=36090 RepID=A0A183BXW9_GLOPA
MHIVPLKMSDSRSLFLLLTTAGVLFVAAAALPSLSNRAKLLMECKSEQLNCSCGWGRCVYEKGWAATGSCCQEKYKFECCAAGPPLNVGNECHGKSANCKCGWAKCIWKKGTPPSVCCERNYAVECCPTL